MPSEQISGATIHCAEKGSGPLLVLLHAFPTDCRMWAAQMEDLASRYHIDHARLSRFWQINRRHDHSLFPHWRRIFTNSSQKLQPRPHQTPTSKPPGNMPAAPEDRYSAAYPLGGYVAMNYAHKYPNDLGGLILADTKDAADNTEQRENRNRMIEVARTKRLARDCRHDDGQDAGCRRRDVATCGCKIPSRHHGSVPRDNHRTRPRRPPRPPGQRATNYQAVPFPISGSWSAIAMRSHRQPSPECHAQKNPRLPIGRNFRRRPHVRDGAAFAGQPGDWDVHGWIEIGGVLFPGYFRGRVGWV